MSGLKIPYSCGKVGFFKTMLILLFVAIGTTGYGRATNAIAAVLMVLIAPQLTFNYKTIYDRKSMNAFFIYFAMIFIIGFNCPDLYYHIGTNIAWTLCMFFPLFVSISVTNNYSNTERLLLLLSIAWFTLVIYSIYVFSFAEMGGRSFAQENRGVAIGGGYPVAYGSALLMSVLLAAVLAKKVSKKLFPWVITAVIVSGIHVIATQSFITIISALMGSLIALLISNPNVKNKKRRMIISFCFLAVVAVLVLVYKKEIGLFLIGFSDLFENDIIKQRIEESGLYLYAGEETNHVGDRSATLEASWKTFTEYPIFGVSYKVGNYFKGLQELGVGAHSEILDAFAKFGIIGSIPFFAIFVNFLKKMDFLYGSEISFPLVCTLLMLVACNPFVSIQSLFMLFLYIPLVLKYFYNDSY